MSKDGSELSNPFPQLAVASSTSSTPSGLVDYRPSYYFTGERLVDLWWEELVRKPAVSRSPDEPSAGGLVIGIRGKFGTGKTHLLLQLIRHIETRVAELSSKGHSPLIAKSVYAKVNRIDAVSFYSNEIVGKFTDDDLKNLVARHLEQLLGKKVSGTGADSLGQAAYEQVSARALDDPQYILNLLQANLLPVAGLAQDLRERLRTTAPGFSLDFCRAYSNVINPSLSVNACRWIRGQELSEVEAGQLSLTQRKISDPVQAEMAFEYLLLAYRQAQIAVFLCLDEIERVVLTGSDEERDLALSRLKNVIEVVSGTGNGVVIGGVEDAWDAMSYRRDVMGRLPSTAVVEIALQPGEASALLEAYCSHEGLALNKVFEPGVVQALVEAGEFNARRILTLAHEAFNESHREPISLNVLERVITKGDLLTSESEVRRQIATVLREEAVLRDFLVLVDFLISDTKFDFALQRNGEVVGVVSIRRSSFKMDEVAAGQSVAASNKVLKRTQVRTCFVMLGYSTQAVRSVLEKAGWNVISYRRETFRSEISMFLDKIVTPSALGRPRFAEAEGELSAIGAKRSTEVSRLDAELNKVQTQAAEEFDRERLIRIGEKFDREIVGLKRELRRMQDTTKREESVSRQCEHISAALRLNEILPESEESELYLLEYRGALELKRSLRDLRLLLRMLQSAADKRLVSLKHGIFFGSMVRLARMSRILQVPIFLTAIAIVFASFSFLRFIPDGTKLSTYRGALVGVKQAVDSLNFSYVSVEPYNRSDARKLLEPSLQKLESAAWESGIHRDRGFIAVENSVQRLLSTVEGSSLDPSRAEADKRVISGIENVDEAINQASAESEFLIAARLANSDFVVQIALVVALGGIMWMGGYVLLRRIQYGSIRGSLHGEGIF